tara:strand:+ start:286 stop:471 length:186 start_codon:yes stop_codon:yes gene_type:complete
MYSSIAHPLTRQKISIHSQLGKNIIMNYKDFLVNYQSQKGGDAATSILEQITATGEKLNGV